jgi:citrate lyase subunit beta / citryl-CoA lyase
MITGLRRSAIYIPCDREDMLEKAVGIHADVLLLNLEDGVAASRKEAARANAVRALTSLDFGVRELVVRINPLESETGRRDIAAVLSARPDGICLPKVETPGAVRDADAIMQEIEAGSRLPAGAVRLHAMIESASGMLAARDIAAASSRMSSLIFGSADYVDDLHCQPGEDRNELMLALQMIVAGARAASIDAIDAPCFDFRNPDLLMRECRQARRLGFDGKSALHPAQIEIIHTVFDVTPEERLWAENVQRELESAEARGRALSTLDGRLIDNPHRAAAERILRRSQKSQTQQ